VRHRTDARNWSRHARRPWTSPPVAAGPAHESAPRSVLPLHAGLRHECVSACSRPAMAAPVALCAAADSRRYVRWQTDTRLSCADPAPDAAQGPDAAL